MTQTARVPPLLQATDPRLRRPAAPIGAVDARVRAAVDALTVRLHEYRAVHGYGRGIAAPQLGLDLRIVVLDLGAGPIALLDPELTWRDPQTHLVWDDCFSLPGRLVRVRRHRSVSLRYRDLQGRERHWQALPPDLAELVQHELDHLDGVLMSDRADGVDALADATQRGALVDAARVPHRLSLDSIAAAAAGIDPVFLHAPQYDCEPLSQALGCRLRLKLETCNPIRSFKGRGADWFLSRRLARGERGALVCASAGNFGQALAYACRKHGIALTVFAATTANPLKLERMAALGATVCLVGHDFDAAKAAARAAADDSGACFVEDGEDAAISEGAGSIAVELFADEPALDTVLLPLGNGALLNGMGRWSKARSPATRVIGVVSRGAPAMATSFRAGPAALPQQTATADTIADGIAVRVPVAAAVADMHGLVDEVIEVDDDMLVAALRLVQRHVGVLAEPAGVAGLAALLAAPARYAGTAVASVIAGGNLSESQRREWLD